MHRHKLILCIAFIILMFNLKFNIGISDNNDDDVVSLEISILSGESKHIIYDIFIQFNNSGINDIYSMFIPFQINDITINNEITMVTHQNIDDECALLIIFYNQIEEIQIRIISKPIIYNYINTNDLVLLLNYDVDRYDEILNQLMKNTFLLDQYRSIKVRFPLTVSKELVYDDPSYINLEGSTFEYSYNDIINNKGILRIRYPGLNKELEAQSIFGITFGLVTALIAFVYMDEEKILAHRRISTAIIFLLIFSTGVFFYFWIREKTLFNIFTPYVIVCLMNTLVSLVWIPILYKSYKL